MTVLTLNDLVSYNTKHNESNGENNGDGDNNSLSCNYGFEGESPTPLIDMTRRKQIRKYARDAFSLTGRADASCRETSSDAHKKETTMHTVRTMKYHG